MDYLLLRSVITFSGNSQEDENDASNNNKNTQRISS